jgi:hypothetical protein
MAVADPLSTQFTDQAFGVWKLVRAHPATQPLRVSLKDLDRPVLVLRDLVASGQTS